MDTHTIRLVGGNRDEFALFTEEQTSNSCALSCTYSGKTISAQKNDFFEALCVIRRELEKDGVMPFCYGASLKVYPSGMSRQMSAGKAAYKMEMGKQTQRSDVVRIFEHGPDVIPSTVEQQRAFFDEWIRCLPKVKGGSSS
jgi:hypothetical protein